MNKKKFGKVLSLVLTTALLATTAISMAACGGNAPVQKTGNRVMNKIDGVEQTKYVFCVSKSAENAQTYVSTLNTIIGQLDFSDITTKYMSGEFRRVDFLGDFGEVDEYFKDKDGGLLKVYTTVCSPYQFSGAYGNGVDGIDMYVMAKLADALNMKPQFNDLAYTTAYSFVKEGRGDIFASAVALTDTVSSDFLVSDVYSTGYQQIVCDEAENFTKISQLKGMNIGVLSGRPGETLIKKAIESGDLKDSGATVTVYETDAEAYSEYLAEQCDVLIVDELSAKVMLKK